MKSFTLIEVLVTIAVFTLAMGAVIGLVVLVYRIHNYTWQQSIAINEARKGIETMVKEIREAKTGDDGSYPIEKAADKEFIFYSDIDKDGAIERVRYFLGTVNSGGQSQECVTFNDGGSCSVDFSNFLQGDLISAEVKVSVDGDFGWNNQEYADITADGITLGDICKNGCSDCPGGWQGSKTFDVKNSAEDDGISFFAQASNKVNNICPHAMKAKFEFSWEENLAGQANQFKRGIINPIGDPLSYPSDQEEITVLSSYVRNTPPIFRYFDGDGNELTQTPARLKDTKLMEVYLIVNVNPDRAPQDFELKSSVQLRNLKSE